MTQTKRVVIIGSGPGGLASAMLLARAGLDVTVLEKQPFVGGRTSHLERDGFRFDRGPTFFLYPPVLEEIFQRCDLDLHREVPMKRLDPQYHLVFEQGGDLLATPQVEKMQQAIAAICPRDAANLPRFLAENRAKFAAFKPILQQPFDSWRDLLRHNPLKLLGHLRPTNSVDRDLRRYFSDERVRLAFSFQSKYLGMSPFQCPSLFTILSFLEYEYGVYHPIGGCAAVSQAMALKAEALGARIRTGEAVTQVLLRDGRAVGVETEQGRYDADAVVVNADFARAMEKLVPDSARRRWSDRKLATKRYSCSTFMLYLGIEGLYDRLAHHTIFLARDYARNLEHIEKRHTLPDNPSIYIQNAGVTDPTLAPQGRSTLYVLAPVTHRRDHIDWSRDAAGFRQVVLNQIRKLGIDDLEDRVVSEQIYTPEDWDTQMDVYRGAVFNLAHTFGQMLHLRPHNRFEDVPGMYLAGGGTHPGSGLPVIYQSALISSDQILNDLEIDAGWEARDTMPLRMREVPSPQPVAAMAGIGS